MPLLMEVPGWLLAEPSRRKRKKNSRNNYSKLKNEKSRKGMPRERISYKR
jgi:hypothetical protein